jgi:murein DD-endopeptidase MepM/ murein hydrolase activator NlpD
MRPPKQIVESPLVEWLEFIGFIITWLWVLWQAAKLLRTHGPPAGPTLRLSILGAVIAALLISPAVPNLKHLIPPALDWPTAGVVSAYFNDGHHTGAANGIDIDGEHGWPVAAAADGRVTHAGCDDYALGCYAILEHAGGFHTVYGNLGEVYVRPGQEVAKGQLIATQGNSGLSMGRHLHFQLTAARPVDPTPFLPPLCPAPPRPLQ